MTQPSLFTGFPALLLGITLGISSDTFAAPGSVDTSFGASGAALVALSSGDDLAYGITVQPDRKVLVAGTSSAGDFALLRLQPNGLPDPVFGNAGKAIHSFGQFELARSVVVLGDGRIVAGGSGLTAGGSRDFAVIRCLPNGSLDPQFGTGGLVTTDLQGGFNDHAFCMAVQPDGKIIVAGYHRLGIAMVRYTAAGELDAGFGSGGKVFSSAITGPEEQAHAIAVQPDGKILISGESRIAGNTDFLLARFNTDGTPDPGFGSGGKAVPPDWFGEGFDTANSLLLLPDGRMLTGGAAGQNFAVARYSSAGVLDQSFGSIGTVEIDFGNTDDTVNGLVLQTDGKIVLAGTTRLNARNYFALIRLTTTGSVDTGFGSGGAVLTAVTAVSDTARCICQQSDGKLLVAGDAGLLNNKEFAVVRYDSGVPGLTLLESWRQTYFGVTAGTGAAANSADPDNDGLPNIVEFGFGLNPVLPGSSQLPAPQFAGGTQVISFTQPWNVSGITYIAEWSPSLAENSWTALPDTGTGTQHRFSFPVAGKNRWFSRIRITVP